METTDDYQDVLIRIPRILYKQVAHIAADWGLSKRTTIHHLIKIGVAETLDDTITTYIKEIGKDR